MPWKNTLRASAFLLLSASSVLTLREALAAGPTHFRDYMLGGMQWGSQKVFRDVLPRYLRSDPEANIFISHIWANNPEVFPRFFGWFDFRRVYFAALDSYLDGSTLPKPRDLVLLTAEEYRALPKHFVVEKFDVRETIAWPDGRIGFYLGHLYLRPEFVRVSRVGEQGAVRPEFVRMRVAGVPSSVLIQGYVIGDDDEVFRQGSRPPVESQPGQELRVQIFFDTPIALQEVEVVYADSAQRELNIVANLDEEMKRTKYEVTTGPISAFKFPLDGTVVNRLYFNLRGTNRDVVRLQEIRVVPAEK
jgi:hypothetical protein